mgnify:CR=1 FL=1
MQTRLQHDGLIYDLLEPEERLELVKNGLVDEDEEISGKINEQYVFNKPTTIAQLKEFLEYCIKDNLGRPAKTIFFPKNIKHARFIQNCFVSIFPEY